MNDDIDPVEFGKLIQAVNNLTIQVINATIRFEKAEVLLAARLQIIETKFSTGRGIAVGVVLAAGGLGAGLSELLQSWFP